MAPANAFFRIGLLKDNRGTVRAFEIKQQNAKTVLILNTVRFALLFFSGKRRILGKKDGKPRA